MAGEGMIVKEKGIDNHGMGGVKEQYTIYTVEITKLAG